MDTAYNSMSPDASMDCKTIVGNTVETPTTPKADHFSTTTTTPNGVTDCTHKPCSNGCPAYNPLEKNKSNESLDTRDCKTPVNVDAVALSAFTVPNAVKMSRQVSTSSSHHSISGNSHSPKSVPSSINKQQQPKGSGAPMNRIDLAPDVTYARPEPAPAASPLAVNNSPMCTPRIRREVAPLIESRYVNYLLFSHTSSFLPDDRCRVKL